ncbi:hypothetical protein rosag_42200 [Roseisolibacter agri]|uniref:1,2-phenylacetyl-CoA epoxidase, subunit B n=1 Tax=Roseisolibacter agri TaxID=2014610 RepID=A0AA37QCE3_9BACT|nr:hypothetical protein rosag_42200 [Roseisolibacter agri]
MPVGEGAGQEQDPTAKAPAAGAPTDGAIADGQWQLWEVFTQETQGAPHEHAGSVRATDAGHALQNARDVYGRRGKVISMWVVPTGAIAASSPSDAGPFFDPMNERPYVHPHFYKAPRGVRGV